MFPVSKTFSISFRVTKTKQMKIGDQMDIEVVLEARRLITHMNVVIVTGQVLVMMLEEVRDMTKTIRGKVIMAEVPSILG